MRRDRGLRKTKVIATIGPACEEPATLRELIRAGMNVARLNLSHGDYAGHERLLERVREASAELGANIAVMIDTKGVEIRTGSIRGGQITLVEGDTLRLYADGREGEAGGVAVSYPHLARDVRPGTSLLIDDGHIELRITAVEGDAVVCEVLRGGVLGERKSVNVPGVDLRFGGMTQENLDDLVFAAHHDVDYLAASHVRSAADVHEIREELEGHGRAIPIIAKIESREGVKNLEEIIEAADGTMVARGDLGVELPVEQVPLIQKKIIRTTVGSGKPVVTATQMLDSMERNARPTRAEASDVANAILDGTSAVMLSGETAQGRHPVAAVRTMASLALRAEAALREYGDLQQIRPHATHYVTEAVAQAAITMAHHLDAAAIVALTESGFTARSISKYRPDCPILAVTRDRSVVRRFALNWGVTGLYHEGGAGDEVAAEFAVARAVEQGWALPGDVVVVTAGISGQIGSTSSIRVIPVT